MTSIIAITINNVNTVTMNANVNLNTSCILWNDNTGILLILLMLNNVMYNNIPVNAKMVISDKEKYTFSLDSSCLSDILFCS
jgi:hypothetical protein